MRKFEDLTDMHKGVFIIRERLKVIEKTIRPNGYGRLEHYEQGMEEVVCHIEEYCNELLDIATLGDIEDHKDNN